MRLYTKDGKPVQILSVSELTKKLEYAHRMVLRRQILARKFDDPGVLGVVRVGNADGIVVLDEPGTAE